MNNAEKFSLRWEGKGDEIGDTSTFWLELLHDVLGVENPGEFVQFQKRVSLDHTSFIDVYIPSTKTIIEQKSYGVNLNKEYQQSDGELLTPYQQNNPVIPVWYNSLILRVWRSSSCLTARILLRLRA